MTNFWLVWEMSKMKDHLLALEDPWWRVKAGPLMQAVLRAP